MNWKKGIIIILPVVVIVAAIGTYLFRTKVKAVNDLVDLNTVTSITLVNGTTGEETVLTNVNLQKDVIYSLAKLELSKTNWGNSTGWVFALILKTDKSVAKLTFINEYKCKDQDGNEYTVKHMDDNLKQFFGINAC